MDLDKLSSVKKFLSKIRDTHLFVWALFTTAVLIAYRPLYYTQDSWRGWDLHCHLQRALYTIAEMSVNMVNPYFDFNHVSHPGHAPNLFYPPLANYILVFFYLITGNLNITLKLATLFIASITILGGSLALIASGYKKSLSLAIALVFITSIYFIDNCFMRGAIPESLALSFSFPYLVLLVSKNKLNSTLKITFTALLASGVLLSNIPCFLCLIVTTVAWICITKNLHFKLLLMSGIFSLGITAFYWMPLLYSLNGDSLLIGKVPGWSGWALLADTHIGLYDLLSGERLHSPNIDPLAVGLGWPLSVFFFQKVYKKEISPLLMIVITLGILITNGADYSFLPDFFSPLKAIQFTWRLIPFLLIFILIYISNNQKKLFPLALVSFLSVLMTTWIPAQKRADNKAEDLIHAEWNDYILEGSRNFYDHGKKLKCFSNSGEFYTDFTESRAKGGLPVIKYQLDQDARCELPVMSYSALTVTNQVLSKEGYLTADSQEGNNTQEVLYKPSFLVITYLGRIISLICFFDALLLILIRISSKSSVHEIISKVKHIATEKS